jgi:hypothetical protein
VGQNFKSAEFGHFQSIDRPGPRRDSDLCAKNKRRIQGDDCSVEVARGLEALAGHPMRSVRPQFVRRNWRQTRCDRTTDRPDIGFDAQN